MFSNVNQYRVIGYDCAAKKEEWMLPAKLFAVTTNLIF